MSNLEAEKLILEKRLEEIQKRRNKNKGILFTERLIINSLMGYSFVYVIESTLTEFDTARAWILLFGMGLVITLLLSCLEYFVMEQVYRIQERSIIADLALARAEKLQENIQDDFFTNLIRINFKYIDQYYFQTQIQANKSFTVSVASALLSFIIIIAGIILMYFGKINSSYVATGAGVLSEFVAAVFFYLYNRTIIKMGEYHHKLVLTQNISLALKITEEMKDEDKSTAQRYLIEQLTQNINQHIADQPEK